jgi:hypothetical protein
MDGDDVCKALTPDLYRTNLFRVLGLPVTAASREVQRREARRALEAKLGLPTDSHAGGSLSLDPPPTQQEVRAAVARLHTPLERFLAEFFWFWPLDDGQDPALLAIEEGRLSDAAALWRGESAHADRRAAAQHNLAVFFHLCALDREHGLAAAATDAEPPADLDGLWQKALGHWANAHADPACWEIVCRRAAALNDAKVSPRLVSQIRESLPTGLLHIHARLAFAAAERSNLAEVTRHLRFLKWTRFDATARHAALRHALASWEQQVEEAIDRAKTTWHAAPHRANENVRAMYDDCSRLVSIVDVVIDNIADPFGSMDGGAFADMRDGLRDRIAEAMFEGQVTFAGKVDDWGESAELLELARKMAAGDALRVLLDDNLSSVREHAKAVSEWCAPGYWDLPDATVAVLEEARELTRRGDFERALTMLDALPLSTGRPLQRAASHCLTVWAVQIFNAAVGEFRQEPAIRRRLIDKLRADRSPPRRFPDAELPDFMKPACPSCGRQDYQRWSQLTIREVPVWLCGDCSDSLDREIEGQRNAFRGVLTSALECQLLAEELYPDDPRSRLNLDILEEHARELHCALPGTASLKARLHHSKRFIPVTLPANPEDGVCHYCGDALPAPECTIRIPMCGDVEIAPRLLGQSTFVSTATIVVPRCRGCRDTHLDLDARRTQWRERQAEISRRLTASRPGRKATLTIGLVGALAGIGITFGMHAAATGEGRFQAGWTWPVVVGLLAAVGTVAVLMGLRRSLAAKADAEIGKFVAETPEPLLAPGIKPEEAYLDFEPLRVLRRRNWSFGHIHAPEQAVPQDVTGRVSTAT